MEGKAAVVTSAQARGARDYDPVAGLWHLFSSPKLALILLLGMAFASWLGSLIMQVPEGVLSNPVDYFQWLERIEEKYGSFWTKVFHWTKLFSVFSSFWFKGLLLLLITNIVVCAINRWKSIWHTVTFRRVVMPPSFYTSGGNTFALTYLGSQVPCELALQSLSQVLRKSRYRVLTERRAGALFLYSDRGRLSRLGTYATHLSIILLLIGVLAAALGFREEAFTVSEGTSRELGRGTGLSVYLEDFTDEWYLNDTPKDYRSEVILFENGAEVRRHVIRVNDPLIYKGIRFHQGFYGTSVVMEVRDREGNLLFNDAVALPWRTRAKTRAEERPLGSFTIPARDLTVYPVLTSGPEDTLILPGQVLLEGYSSSSFNRPLFAELLTLKQPKALGDLEFTFVRERQFTGLQVVRAPGTPLVWVASFLLVAGNVAVLFFPLRQVWARSYRDEQGQTLLEVRALAARDLELDKELRRLQEQVERLFPAQGKGERRLSARGKEESKRALALSAASRRESNRGGW